MDRYNSFNQIHKALRVMMYDTAALISQTDFDNAQQAADVQERVQQVLFLFDKHAHHEDTMVLPMVQKYEPAVVEAFEQEHVTDHQLSEKVRGFQIALSYAVLPEAKRQLGNALGVSFTEFMVFNLQHMRKEETVLNTILWRYYSDAELLALSQKIAASIPPEESMIAAKWMFKGLSNQEITGWMRSIERNAPNPVFRQLFTLAEKELEQSRFRLILEGMTQDQLIAS